MRILITNDDGINAPGLKTLQAIATEVAGPTREIWTVAPAFEQSGVGHCISYTRPTMISQHGDKRFEPGGVNSVVIGNKNSHVMSRSSCHTVSCVNLTGQAPDADEIAAVAAETQISV